MAMGLIEPIVSGSKTATDLASLTKCDKQLIGMVYPRHGLSSVPNVVNSPNTSTSINDENCRGNRMREVRRDSHHQDPHSPFSRRRI